ncbi:RNA polymerase sigma-B factor [compost metagenome]
MTTTKFGMTVDQFVSKYKGVVSKAAHMVPNKNGILSYDDMHSTGMEALVRCFNNLDESKIEEGRILAYLSMCVKGYMKNYIRDRGYPVKASRKIADALVHINSLGLIEHSEHEISEYTGLDIKLVEQALLLSKSRVLSSMDAPISQDEGDTTFHELYASNSHLEFESVEMSIMLKEFISTLTKRDAKMFMSYLSGDPQRIIAQNLGISQMTVSRVMNKTILKARKFFTSDGPNNRVEVSTVPNYESHGNVNLLKEMILSGEKKTDVLVKATKCHENTVRRWKKKLQQTKTAETQVGKARLKAGFPVEEEAAKSPALQDTSPSLSPPLLPSPKKEVEEVCFLKEEKSSISLQGYVKSEDILEYFKQLGGLAKVSSGGSSLYVEISIKTV